MMMMITGYEHKRGAVWEEELGRERRGSGQRKGFLGEKRIEV
jgi:hypothetical protein